MIINILEYVYSAVLFIIGMYAYVFVLGTVLPKFLLVLEYKGELDGRGLRKYTFPNGRAITYETHPSIRRFIPAYLLICKDGFKYVKIKTVSAVYFVNYDVVAFDNQGKVLDIINVKEHISSLSNARSVILPAATSYVNLVLYRVNGRKFVKTPPYSFNTVKKNIYKVLVSLFTFAFTFVLVSNLNMLGKWIKTLVDIRFDVTINLFSTILISLLASLIYIGVTLSGNKRRASR